MKRRHFLLSGTASAALALTGCGGGGSESTATSASNAANSAGSAPRMQIAAAAGGVSYPFGSRPSKYVAGIKPSAANASADAMLAAQYDAWKAARAVNVSWIVPGGYAVQFSNTAFLTVSEGMGYGMLLAVLFAGHDPNAQQLFDGLLALARNKYAYSVAQYDPNGKYLMEWELNANGTSAGGGWSALDGDLDIAMALLMADRQWGSGGTWNYKQEALNTIGALKSWHFDAATGAVGGRGARTPGLARMSDFMFGHFRAFRAATGDSFWDMVISKNLAVLDYLQNTYSAGVGLLPDWAVNVTGNAPSPSPGYLGDGIAQEMDYWWNSCRDPWRLGTDYVLSGDPTVKTICGRITQFFQNQVNWGGGVVTAIGTGYTLSGGMLASGQSPAYQGPIMVGACIDPSYQTLADALWNWNASNLTTGYYDSEIQLLSMVVASGNWWTPATAGTATQSAAATQQPATSQPAAQATAAAAAGNLLVNGDFSAGLTNWINWGNAQVVAGALQVGAWVAGGVSQDVASKLTAGASYQLSATANISAAGEGIYIGVKLMDAAGNVLLNQVQPGSSLTPGNVSLTFTAPQGAASGYVYIWKNATAAIGTVDNLTLTAGAGRAAAAPSNTSSASGTGTVGTNLLTNGNFASGMANWNNWGNAQASGGAVQVAAWVAGGCSQDITGKVSAGANYKLTGTANITAAAEGVFIGVQLFNASGAMVVNQSQLVSATSASGFTVPFTAPAGVVSGNVFIWKNANAAAGVVTNLSLVAA